MFSDHKLPASQKLNLADCLALSLPALKMKAGVRKKVNGRSVMLSMVWPRRLAANLTRC